MPFWIPEGPIRELFIQFHRESGVYTSRFKAKIKPHGAKNRLKLH